MGLQSLWYVSLILTGISLLIMSGLIVARLLSTRRDRLLAEERNRLISLLLDPAGVEANLSRSRLAGRLLADLSVELIQLVRGEERDQLVGAATRLGVAEMLRKQLSARSSRTRVSAAESLAHFPDSFSADTLERALDDRNSNVRLAAAMSLAESGRSPPARFLVGHLGLGGSERSMLMVDLLRKIEASRPGEIEQLVGDREMPSSVKAAAIDALAGSADYRLVPLINRLALETDPMNEELPRFLRALGAFHHPAGAPAVRHWLQAEVWWVRAAAAEASGRIGLEELVPRLAELLGDDSWWVRFRAGEALVRMGPEGQRRLSSAARRATEPARSAARLTLAEQGIAE